MLKFNSFNLNNFADSLIVTDKKIAKLYNVQGNNVYVLPQGEKAKTFYHAQKLCEWFLSKNLQKNGKVVALGGGSVGDVVGFAASIYKRGVKLTVVPTTLLSMIDSAIGGKTAIDLCGIKNAVGSFIKADTLIDTTFLSTLPKKQMLNGKGELIKYCMLNSQIEQIYLDGNLQQTIKACAKYKQAVCRADFFDKGERKSLNMGHTIGHAMELSCNLSHGVAVANGLFYEVALSNKLGFCSKDFCQKWQNKIASEFTIYPLKDGILQQMQQDKKNVQNKICFVLPTENGYKTEYLTLQAVQTLCFM